MNYIKFIQSKIPCAIICFFVIIPFNKARANEDSLNLAQCYANLSITLSYLDTLPMERVAKIIPYIAGKLDKITDTAFIRSNSALYNMAYAHLHFLRAKQMFKNTTQRNRAFLLRWKNSLDSTLFYFNKGNQPDKANEYYVFTGFNSKTADSLKFSFIKLKDTANLFFNKDIYPDFKRIFYAAKNEGKYYFDSLKYYASLYNLPLDLSINEDRYPSYHKYAYEGNLIIETDKLSLPLDLISEFLQFNFVLNDKAAIHTPCLVVQAFNNFSRQLNPKSDTTFGSYSNIAKDDFFKKELNKAAYDTLHKKLKKRFNFNCKSLPWRITKPVNVSLNKYYFPIPAPFPSSKYAINHFVPQLKTMGEVSNYISTNFFKAGYQGHLHYYYIKYPGFAVSTDIERINKDGSPATENIRWNLKMSDDGKLTLYQMFKSIFFETESDFRIIACIVAPREIETDSSNKKASIQAMSGLLQNSYSTIPNDLESVILPDKTLTILVYHFNQSDIGEVPVLASSDKLVVPQHLQKTHPLNNLLN